MLSNFIPTIYFGVFTGIAMLLAMISVLTLLPQLILTIKPLGKKIKNIMLEEFIDYLSGLNLFDIIFFPYINFTLLFNVS